MAEYRPFGKNVKPGASVSKSKPNPKKLTIKEALQVLGRATPTSDMAQRNRTMDVPYPTYSQRSNFYGKGPTADYQGPMLGSGVGTRDRMPGTTPEETKTKLQQLLEMLRIRKPQPKEGKDKQKEIAPPGSRYAQYI
jgi:hypothetical protein